MNDMKKPITNHEAWWWRASPATCGGLAALLGAVVLLGWYTHDRALIQVRPAFVPMQYNTALCFVLCGIGMLLLHHRPSVATLCGVLTTSIGLLTLAQYLFGTERGLDQLFMKH